MFKPTLPHNLRAHRRIVRWKKWVIGSAVLCAIVSAAFAPVRYLETLLVPFLLSYATILGVLEVKRVLIFRKDLQERGSGAREGGSEGTPEP